MNGLLSKCLALMVVVFGGILQVDASGVTQMMFRLPAYPQEDRDISIVQNFLLYQAFSEVDANKKEGYSYVLSFNGELEIEGRQEEIYFFAGALGKAIAKVIREEFNEKAFQQRKEEYLASSENLVENALIEEIKQGDLLKAKDSLEPFAKMLCAASSMASESPPLTLVADHSQCHLFYSLPISQADQDNISKLIKTMGRSGPIDLLKKAKEMEKLGDKLNHVHPLRFIGYIYSHPQLKDDMSKIMDNVFKRGGFLNGHGKKEGFSHRMSREMHHNNLMHYLPGFTQSLGISEDEISSFFHHHDWEGLLRRLIKKC